MSFSNTYEDKVMDHIFSKSAPLTPMLPLSIGLCTANPTDSGTSTICYELADANGYARVVTIEGNWNVSSGGIITNADAIVFPKATGDWGQATHFALFTSQLYGLGDLVMYGPLSLPINIPTGYRVRFNAGQLEASLD